MSPAEAKVQLLVGNDHVDVVFAPQAVVGDGQQTIDIRRKVDARDRGALIQHHVEESRILMSKAVVILPPNRRSNEEVQGGYFLAPRKAVRDRQPLGVLVKHGVNHVHEGLVGREKAISSGQQIAFEHAFHGVLTEHLDDSTVRRKFAAVLVFREVLGDPEFLGRLVDRLQFVGGGFVGAEHTEVVHVQLHHVS